MNVSMLNRYSYREPIEHAPVQLPDLPDPFSVASPYLTLPDAVLFERIHILGQSLALKHLHEIVLSKIQPSSQCPPCLVSVLII